MWILKQLVNENSNKKLVTAEINNQKITSLSVSLEWHQVIRFIWNS